MYVLSNSRAAPLKGSQATAVATAARLYLELQFEEHTSLTAASALHNIALLCLLAVRLRVITGPALLGWTLAVANEIGNLVKIIAKTILYACLT